MFKEVKFEEQHSKNKKLKQLLDIASKRNTGKRGSPEFIISIPSIIDAVIIIECKASVKDHERKKKESINPQKYAVDGVLHYANFLKKDFDVIAIAISGEKKDQIIISDFFIKKNSQKIIPLKNNKLLTIYDYLNIFEEKEKVEKLKDINLLKLASDLNKELYNYSVPENERATIVSGILLALQNKHFRESFRVDQKPSELVEDLLIAIERVLTSKKIGSKIKILLGEYQKISQSNKLAISEIVRNNESGEDEKNFLLRDIIDELDKKVFPFTQSDHIGYDILGQFYSEFIRYVYGDKELGLVLTPQHIAELFVDIAEPDVDSVFYDSCCGTGGFLIKALKKLWNLAGNDLKKKDEIKLHQLIGIEARSDMFTYTCSNMMMRGDGKSNISLGDSLSNSNKEKIKKLKPAIGFLNPPYSTSVSELEFVFHNLFCLEKKGICVSIIPISCVSAVSGTDYDWKKKLLLKHTLEAVFTMPVDLFNPASSTGTVIVVFKAHIPHPEDFETYFARWNDDGFIKIKHLGRVDYRNKWKKIKESWIYDYRNGKENLEYSIKKHVTAEDEWLAEAYLKTDYSNIDKELFEHEIKKYILFSELNK